jgi:hypothetical protein
VHATGLDPVVLSEEMSRAGLFLELGMVSVHGRSLSKRRAFGGCLGTRRRRRTWHAAKSHGEPRAGVDPWMSEWGNPPRWGIFT